MVNFFLRMITLSVISFSGNNAPNPTEGQYSTYDRHLYCTSNVNVPLYQSMVLSNSPNPNINYGAEGYLSFDLITWWDFSYQYINSQLSYECTLSVIEMHNIHYYLNLNSNGDVIDMPLSTRTLSIQFNNQYYGGYDYFNFETFEESLQHYVFDYNYLNSGSNEFLYFRFLYKEDLNSVSNIVLGNTRGINGQDSEYPRLIIDPNNDYTYSNGKEFSNSYGLGARNGYLYLGFGSNNVRELENYLTVDQTSYYFDDGYDYGYNQGYIEGYGRGHAEGYNEGFNADTVSTTIFNGILYIGLLPINVFLACFNFDILGINMSSFVTAMLSVAFVVIIFRFLFNGKSGD